MIAIGCDHGGYNLKQQIMKHLDEKGIPYKDFGTYGLESVDYPVYARQVCNSINSGECEKGILVCTTGQGMCIMANKQKGIRAVCCSDTRCALFTRKHNNANVLTLGESITGAGIAFDIVDIFLTTEFEGGRHAQRVAQFET